MAGKLDRKIKLAVFDMDDTLYNERDYVHSGYRAVAGFLANKHADKDISDKKISQWMWQRFNSGKISNMFNALSDEFSLGLSEQNIAELVQVYRNHRPDITALTEAVKLLDKFKGRIKLALLSDGFLPAQQYKLDALELEHYFDCIVFTESLGREFWKPSQAGFEKIAANLNIPHENCVYIADNAAKDFAGPNSLGWQTIQWKREAQVHRKPPPDIHFEPDIVAHNSNEISQYIKY